MLNYSVIGIVIAARDSKLDAKLGSAKFFGIAKLIDEGSSMTNDQPLHLKNEKGH
jgi:hypothetical protein